MQQLKQPHNNVLRNKFLKNTGCLKPKGKKGESKQTFTKFSFTKFLCCFSCYFVIWEAQNINQIEEILL